MGETKTQGDKRPSIAGSQKITVLDPTGYAPKVTQIAMAPRLSSLDGKKVYLVDARFDDADLFLKQVQASETFASAYPKSTCASPTRCTSGMNTSCFIRKSFLTTSFTWVYFPP